VLITPSRSAAAEVAGATFRVPLDPPISPGNYTYAIRAGNASENGTISIKPPVGGGPGKGSPTEEPPETLVPVDAPGFGSFTSLLAMLILIGTLLARRT